MSLIKKSGLRQPQAHITRRDFLRLAAAAAALAACGRVAGQSEIVMTAPVAAASPTETVAAPQAQHWLAANRLMFGPTPGDIDHIAAIGLDAFIEEQLAHDKQDPAEAEKRIDAITGLRDTLTARPRELTDDKRQDIYQDIAQATLLRAVYNPAQLYELMVDFWSNHFNILFQKNTGEYLKTSDDRDVIRPNALGKFRDLLGASAHSPAMLVYLDNQSNRKGKPNENYARELMELHTLGVDGGYTQADVQDVARALTGWSMVPVRFKGGQMQPGIDDVGTFVFRPRQHDDDAKRILGIDFPASGGKADGERVLDILAKHPSAATFISLKMARRFVSDQPPTAVIQLGAQAFAKSDGDLRATLGAILHSAEFKQSAGQKLKRPLELIVGALRATGAQTDGGKPISAALRGMGQPLFGWAAPNGYPDVAGAWLGSSLVLARWNFGMALGANTLKGTRIDIGAANIDTLSTRLLGAALPQPAREALQPFANDAATLIGLLLSAPLFQVRG